MILVYENLGEIHGYYHDGIIHINETIPAYLQKHVKQYLEACHKRSPELKVYYMRCIETDTQIFKSLYKGWNGNLHDYMTDDEIKDIAQRMREKYPEYAVSNDVEMVMKIIALCEK